MDYRDLEAGGIGPERVVRVHDPETGLHGFAAIDTHAFGPITGGGVRLAPDVSGPEVAHLARAMTYKFAALGLPMGGAKSGIAADPGLSGERRARLLRAFGRAIAPLYAEGMRIGADMGTDQDDVALMLAGAGASPAGAGLSTRKKDGEAMENHATGFGVAVSAAAAADAAGFGLEGAHVAIEGFGKVGGGVARYLTGLGARVVAVTTAEGGVFDPEGLDISALLEARAAKGDKAVLDYDGGRPILPEEIFALPVEVLIPGARPHVLTAQNVGCVEARAITSIANVPITEEGEAILHAKGVAVVPDFVSNAGGAVLAFLDWLGADEAQLFAALEHVIGETAREALAAGKRQGRPPGAILRERTAEKVHAARQAGERATLEDVLDAARARFLS